MDTTTTPNRSRRVRHTVAALLALSTAAVNDARSSLTLLFTPHD